LVSSEEKSPDVSNEVSPTAKPSSGIGVGKAAEKLDNAASGFGLGTPVPLTAVAAVIDVVSADDGSPGDSSDSVGATISGRDGMGGSKNAARSALADVSG